MAKLFWSEQARQSLDMMPPVAREGLEQRLDYLQSMPRMYAITEDNRFPGCRTFWVEPCYRVFYMVGAEANDAYVTAILEEEVDLPGDGSEY